MNPVIATQSAANDPRKVVPEYGLALEVGSWDAACEVLLTKRKLVI